MSCISVDKESHHKSDVSAVNLCFSCKYENTTETNKQE